jgi:hypothetical protein
MTLAKTLSVLILTVAPGLAFAQGCPHEKLDETAASCVPGMVWDSATSTCVSNPTS